MTSETEGAPIVTRDSWSLAHELGAAQPIREALPVGCPAYRRTPNAWLTGLARELGVSKRSLLVMSPDCDPYNTGTPSHIEAAEWFRDLMLRHPSTMTHLRRLHYRAIDDDVLMPDGTPYLNDSRCWDWLNKAATYARNLGIVPREAISDKRSRAWLFVEPLVTFPPRVVVEEGTETPWTVEPVSVKLMRPLVYGYSYDVRQDVRIGLFCEKSTADDVLVPLAEELGIDYLSAQGYASHTRIHEFLARDTERPARLVCISDFDPAGDSMPRAFARAVEFMREDGPQDVAVTPLALTCAQVHEFDLPEAPLDLNVSVSVRNKRARFMARYGVAGAVELDALIARHPGALERMIRQTVEELRDQSLRQRLGLAHWEAIAAVDQVWSEHEAPLAEATEVVGSLLVASADRYRAELDEIATGEAMQRLTELQDAMRADLAALELPGRPEPERDDQEHDWLYRSDREFLVQLEHYRRATEGAA